jgi:hypothetical protein
VFPRAFDVARDLTQQRERQSRFDDGARSDEDLSNELFAKSRRAHVTHARDARSSRRSSA